MLDQKTCKLIKSEIDKVMGKGFMDMENISRMQPIPTHTLRGGHTVLATQFSDITILVRIQVSESFGVTVRSVKSVTL